ncbi:peptidase [Streptomyces mashuensis]|uniref:Neutral metalloproteinase n=1 Tax=Streptomyces mashuensis TaxID=33904 RepID=A0A919EE26_9ACTN|nr:M4 family metallopeptidase [Streptomyces mashuensis]GHF50235.1 peptidase [Streptomyces mashuensis]
MRQTSRITGISTATVAAALLATGFSAGPAAAKDDPWTSIGLGSKEQLVARGTVTDPDGTVHARYERTYDGIPVLGGDLVVHRAPGGKIEEVTKATDAQIKVPTTRPGLAAPSAEKTALAAARAAGAKDASAARAPRKVIWAASGKPVLAYETVVEGLQHDGTPSRLHVITDAGNGKKLHQFETVVTGTGTGQYNGKVKVGSVKSGKSFLLKDNARGGHQTYNLQHGEEGKGKAFTDADDVWGNGKPDMAQTAAVDAQYGAAVTWDYYKDTFGRKGIRNDGKAAYSRVHFGKGYVNAFWDDECFCMTYGDGQGDKKPLTSLDVAAHEMTHGVTSATANLQYNGESGGLNEATSDIMATNVEFYAKNAADPGDYLIGEKIDINGNGTALRYMDKPSKDGESPDFWNPKLGELDVHYSSGVANHFFYLLSEGSGKKVINGVKYDSPTQDGKAVKGIGREAAAKIWYKALTTYMTSTTDYKGARVATLKAAQSLYGKNSTQYKAVAAAWTGVNVK